MKTKTQYRDDRFDVSNETEILNRIKKNNRTLELLTKFDEICELFYRNCFDEGLGTGLIYKDDEDNEVDISDFWCHLDDWSTENQTFLVKNSKELYTKLFKPRKS